MAAAGIVFNTIFVLTAFVTVNPEDETLPAKGEFDTLTNDPVSQKKKFLFMFSLLFLFLCM